MSAADGFEGGRYGCVGVCGRGGEGCVKRVERGVVGCLVGSVCVARIVRGRRVYGERLLRMGVHGVAVFWAEMRMVALVRCGFCAGGEDEVDGGALWGICVLRQQCVLLSGSL